ncbi:MAG: DNA polymerase III subunit delta [Oscillospiraceae bacterium]|nr:DNA polymerase III subunit delta [Oscillospiraceae bacterium]
MALLNDSELAKSIRDGDIKRAYFFYGKDVAVLEAFAKKLVVKLAGKDETSLNLHKLDGRKLKMSELWDCCNMLPCFADRVVVTVNDLNAESLNKDDFEYLVSMIKDLPDTTTVIFYVTGIDIYKNKKSLTDKNEKLNKLFQSVGHSCEFSFKTPSDLAKTIITKLRKAECDISKDDASYLAQKCLCEQAVINNEIEKLASYVAGGVVTREIIDDLCMRRLDADSFRLAGYIVKGDAKMAFSLISELYDMQVSTLAIIGSMTNSFCDIYRARAATSCGKGMSDISADFNYPKNREFTIRYALNDCRNVSDARIRRCIKALFEADNEAKYSNIDDRIVLERAVSVMLER